MTRATRDRLLFRALPAASLFAMLATIYLITSGAPLRVHVLSLSCLALAIIPSTYLLGTARPSRNHWIAASGFIALSMLVWDASNWLVILKSEPFEALRYAPFVYLFGFACIAILVLAAARLPRWAHRSPRRPASD